LYPHTHTFFYQDLVISPPPTFSGHYSINACVVTYVDCLKVSRVSCYSTIQHNIINLGLIKSNGNFDKKSEYIPVIHLSYLHIQILSPSVNVCTVHVYVVYICTL
jgi:hypothetical protein